MSGATLTACEGDRPAWSFGFRSGRVTLERYARLHDVVFRMGGVPLIYTPYILWPAMRERASGFLIPAIGYNSQRGGFLGVSYFWAISRSADATFSGELYTKKVGGGGVELRLRPSLGTSFEGTAYTLHDPELGGWGWKTRGKLAADDLLPHARLVVSWLDFSDLPFFQTYERDFNLSAMRAIKSEAFLTWGRDPFSANFRLDREEALFGVASVVSERRPALEARLRPTPILGQRLFLQAEGQVGLLRSGQVTPGCEEGHPETCPVYKPTGLYDRVDLYPRLSAPFSSIPWLGLQAEVGARVTSYGKSVSADGRTLDPERYTRKTFTLGLEATGPSFSRIFEGPVGPFTKLKHVIEPRFDYEYGTDPGDLARAPRFDEVDAVSPAHTLRYSLVQRLLAKRKEGSATEIASLEISRIHYFRLPGEGTPQGAPAGLSRNSPVDATLRVNAGQGLSFDARGTWDMTEPQLTSMSLSAVVTSKDRSLLLSLFENRPIGPAPSSSQLRVAGGTPIIPKRLRLDVQASYDLSQRKFQELRSLLTVEAACFKILVEYRDLRVGAVPSRDFRVGLNLKNIGSFLDFPVSLP
jgi:hypothetical protein